MDHTSDALKFVINLENSKVNDRSQKASKEVVARSNFYKNKRQSFDGQQQNARSGMNYNMAGIAKVAQPTMSAENIYCTDDVSKSHGGDITGSQPDVKNIYCQNVSSFSSNQNFDSNAQMKPKHELIDRVNNLSSEPSERDNQRVQANINDKTENSTVFRSSKNSKALSPFTSKNLLFDVNKDLPMNLKAVVSYQNRLKNNQDYDVENDSNIMVSDTSFKPYPYENYDENVVALKTKLFEFNQIKCRPMSANK